MSSLRHLAISAITCCYRSITSQAMIERPILTFEIYDMYCSLFHVVLVIIMVVVWTCIRGITYASFVISVIEVMTGYSVLLCFLSDYHKNKWINLISLMLYMSLPHFFVYHTFAGLALLPVWNILKFVYCSFSVPCNAGKNDGFSTLHSKSFYTVTTKWMLVYKTLYSCLAPVHA